MLLGMKSLWDSHFFCLNDFLAPVLKILNLEWKRTEKDDGSSLSSLMTKEEFVRNKNLFLKCGLLTKSTLQSWPAILKQLKIVIFKRTGR